MTARRRSPTVVPVRRGFLWLQLAAATVVVVGVLLQAFSISADARGAGRGALDTHEAIGGITHLVEVVFLAALAAWRKAWGEVGLALALPVIGTLQVFLVGDTEESGGWANGLHGLFALVVLTVAAVIAHRTMRGLGPRRARLAAR